MRETERGAGRGREEKKMDKEVLRKEGEGRRKEWEDETGEREKGTEQGRGRGRVMWGKDRG